MKNLRTYETWLLLEKNKTVEYFEKHPEALSSIARDLGIQPHHKHEFKPSRAVDPSGSADAVAYTKINKAAKMKLMKIGGEVGEMKFNQAVWKYGDLIIGQLEGWSGWYDSDYLRKAIVDAKSFEDWKAEQTKTKYSRQWRFPSEDYSKDWNIEEEPIKPFYDWIGKYWNQLQDICKWLQKAREGAKNIASKRAQKEFMKLGLSMKDVEVAMTYVKEWTSMSRKKLDPSVWPLLQKISVDDTKLPQYIYRGIFYDGAKIKDAEKWKKKWFPGAKPGASQGKATSWTIDRGTAADFMQNQDFIKDSENGYYMLLKWKVDPKFVIADLRNLPVDHTFWNQQELIVSPEATDYEVDVMIPGSEGRDAYKEFVSSNKGGQGAWGKTKADFAMDFMNTPYETLSPGDRIEFKQVAKMTVAEYKKAFPQNRITDEPDWQDMPMPIFNCIHRFMSGVRVTSVKGGEVKFRIELRLQNLDYSSDPLVKETYKKYYDEMKFNQFSGTTEIVSNEGTITLIDDDYYDMDLKLEMPTEYRTQITKTGNPNQNDALSDKALDTIFNEVGGSKHFAQSQLQIKKKDFENLPRNIKIAIS